MRVRASRRGLAWLGLAWTASCAAPPEYPAFAPAQLEPRSYEHGAAAVVLEEDRLVDGTSFRTVVRIRRSILVRRPEGLSVANLVEQVPALARSVRLRGITRHPDGRVIALDGDAVERVRWLQPSESKELAYPLVVAALPEVAPGSILSIQLEWVEPYLSDWSRLALDTSLPIRSARVELRVARLADVFSRSRGFHRAQVDRNRVVLTASDVPASPEEPFSSGNPAYSVEWIVQPAAQSEADPVPSWSQLVQRLAAEELDRWGPLPELIGGLDSASFVDRVRHVYRRVQDHVLDDDRPWKRSTGRSLPAVWASARASARERALLMAAGLDALQVANRLVAVLPPGTDPASIPPPHPVDLRDQLLVRAEIVEGVYLYLDPSCHRCRAGQIVEELQGRVGLVFDLRAPSEPVQPEPLPVEASPDTVRATVRATAEGLEWRDARHEFFGPAARYLRQRLWEKPTTDAERQSLTRQLVGHPGWADLGLDARGGPGDPVVVTASSAVDAFAVFGADEARVDLPLSTLVPLSWVDALLAAPRPRVTEIALGAQGRSRWTLRVEGPTGWQLEPTPASGGASGPVGSWSLKLNPDGDAAELELELAMAPRWPAEEAEAMFELLEGLRAALALELSWTAPKPPETTASNL